MNLKKAFHSLLVILTCCLSFSCVLDVLPENKTGSVSFTLPQKSSVESRTAEAQNEELPNEYKVVAISVKSEKEVYNRNHVAGASVSIPDLEYGNYKIIISGNTTDKYFEGSVEVNIDRPSVSAEIALESSKRYGSILLSVDVGNTSINEVVYNVFENEKLIDKEKPVPLVEGKGSINITGLYLGSKYHVQVLASDGNYVYVGKAAQSSISLSDKEPTKLDFNEFTVVTGNILLKGPDSNPQALIDSTIIVKSVKPDDTSYTPKTVKTITLKDTDFIPEYKGYLITNLSAGSYLIEIQSIVATEVYYLDEIIQVMAGQDISNNNSITVTNRDIFYVSAFGDDNNPGTYSAPFRTLNKAINQATDQSRIIIQDEFLAEDFETINIDKSIYLFITSSVEQGSEVNANINVSNENASIVLSNVSVNAITASAGTINLYDNCIVRDAVDVSGAAILNLDNPKSFGTNPQGHGIILGEGNSINIIGDLPLEFTSKLTLRNYDITTPIISNASGEKLNPKNIASFTLTDTNYQINSDGCVELKQSSIVIPKGSIKIVNTDKSFESVQGLEVTVSDGREFSETKNLDSFPLIFDVDVGIYNVSIKSHPGINVHFIDGTFYQVKEGSPATVDISAKNLVTLSFTVPIKDLVSPYFVLKHGNKEIERTELALTETSTQINVISKPYLVSTGETLTACIENQILNDASVEKVIVFSNDYVVKSGDTEVAIDMPQVRAIYSVAPNLSDVGVYRGSKFKVSVDNKTYSASYNSDPATPVTPVSTSIGYVELNQPLNLTAMIHNLDDEYSYYSGSITPTGNEENRTIKLDMTPNRDKVFLWGKNLDAEERFNPLYKIDYSKNYVNQNVLDSNTFNGFVVDHVLYPNNRVAVLNMDTSSNNRYITIYSETGKVINNIDLSTCIPPTADNRLRYNSITSNTEQEFYVSYFSESIGDGSIHDSQLAKISIPSSPTESAQVQNFNLINKPQGHSGNMVSDCLYELTNSVIANSSTIYLSYVRYKDVETTDLPPEIQKVEDGFIVYKGTISNNDINLELIFDSHTPTELQNKIFMNTDMYYQNGLLYLLALDITQGPVNRAINSLSYSSRGALITVDATKKVTINGLNTKLLSDADEETNKSNFILKENDELLNSTFLGPRKIVAIKEKELIIADAGAIYCPSKKTHSNFTPLELEKRLIKVDFNGKILGCENLLNKDLFDGNIGGHEGSGFVYIPF